MTTWTVVTVVRRGEFSVLAVLDGGYQAAGSPATDEDTEIFTHLIEAESREQAEQFVREKYFPQSGAIEEPPC